AVGRVRGPLRPSSPSRFPMNPLSILLLALAMSTDAFAAAIGKGAAMRTPRWRDALRAGLVFGLIEATTPIVGWLLGSSAPAAVEAWDHWIAFGLLAALGLHMIHKALRGGTDDDAAPQRGLGTLALAGLATSIDALAVGVGLAFVEVDILAVAA